MEHSELVQEMSTLEGWTAQDRIKLAKQRREQQVARWIQEQQKLSVDSKSIVNRKNISHVQFPANIILLEATARQDFDEVLTLLEKNKYDPNVANEDGLTPIHQCSIDDSEEILRLLIKYGGDVNVKDRDRWTPLHAAATCGHAEICKTLIDNGADLLAMNGDGNMPYDICEDDTTLDLIESEMDRAGISQEMIDRKRILVEEQMIDDLKNLLAQSATSKVESIGNILSYQDKDGATPLHIASAYGYQTVVDFLLERNVPLDIRDKDGWTPIHVAVFWGQVFVLRQLINKGANIYQKLPDGRSSLELCDDPEVRVFMVNTREQYLQNQEQLVAATLAAVKSSENQLNKLQYSQSLTSTMPNFNTIQIRAGYMYESRSSVSSPYDSSSSLNRTGSIRRISSIDREKVKKFNESYLDVLEARNKNKKSTKETETRKQIPTDLTDSSSEDSSTIEKSSLEKTNSEATTIRNSVETKPPIVPTIPAETLSEMKKQRVERRRQVVGPFTTEIFPINSPPVIIHSSNENKTQTPTTKSLNEKVFNQNNSKTIHNEKKRICCTIL